MTMFLADLYSTGAVAQAVERRDVLLSLCVELRQAASRLSADVVMASRPDTSEGDAELGIVLDAVETQTRALATELDRLNSTLGARIAARQHEQVTAALKSAQGRLKLHFGSGRSDVDGWVNVDVAFGDVMADLRRPLPFPPESASHIYACHVLEHLRFPDEAHGFLRECRRILRRGAKIRLVVPNIAEYLRAYDERDDSFWETHRETWGWSESDGTHLDQILQYAGSSADDRDLFGHRHGYDAHSLRTLMQAAGLPPCGCARTRVPPTRPFESTIVPPLRRSTTTAARSACLPRVSRCSRPWGGRPTTAELLIQRC